MADSRRPSAEEVRALVQRIVDQTLEGSTEAAPAADGRTVVAIAGDHGGWRLKDAIGRWLEEHGYVVRDCGTHSDEAVDYPDLALAVARLVADGTACCGIVVDGAGIGSAMAANKVPGVRAANCHDISSARNSREHNYANVLTLGSGFLGQPLALQIVETWLDTEWGAERHGRRVEKISAIERSYTGVTGGKDR
ncbi:MAG: ribose 5-phosphate isomerase B [Candidatus Limnocylindrales bacterium]